MTTLSTEDGQDGVTVLVQRDGGVRVTVSGAPASNRYRVLISGLTCYSGVAGQGTTLVPKDGKFDFVVPELPLGTYDLAIQDGDGGALETVSGAIQVVAREFRSSTRRLRNNLSPRWNVGYRDPVQEGSQ